MESYRHLYVRYKNTYSAEQLLAWTERFLSYGAVTNGSASDMPHLSTSTTATSIHAPWCRFPILSGGFEKELAELRAYKWRHSTENGGKGIGF